MTYLDLAVLQLRTLVNDLDCDDYIYSDARLKQLILVSALRVLSQLTDDEYTVSFENGTITETPDAALTNLIVLNAACLMTRGEAKSASGCSVKVVDGPSTIDLGDMYSSAKEMSESFCEQYESEKSRYLLKTSIGYSSITPKGSGGWRCGGC